MNKDKIRDLILDLYETDPDVVNDRTLLLQRVWYRCGWNDFKPMLHNLPLMPSAETVSRRLRELHEEGLIIYADTELERRTDAFKRELDEHTTIQQTRAVSWLND